MNIILAAVEKDPWGRKNKPRQNKTSVAQLEKEHRGGKAIRARERW